MSISISISVHIYLYIWRSHWTKCRSSTPKSLISPSYQVSSFSKNTETRLFNSSFPYVTAPGCLAASSTARKLTRFGSICGPSAVPRRKGALPPRDLPRGMSRPATSWGGAGFITGGLGERTGTDALRPPVVGAAGGDEAIRIGSIRAADTSAPRV